MPGKSQIQLDQERDLAVQQAQAVARKVAQLKIDSERDHALAEKAGELVIEAVERVDEQSELKQQAELAISKDTREMVIEAARESVTEVDEGTAPTFTPEQAKKIGDEFDQQQKTARELLERVTKALALAEQTLKQTGVNEEQARKQSLASLRLYTDGQHELILADADAAIATELSQQGLKKRIRWLAWDGSLGIGTCNTLPPDPNSPAAQARLAYANRVLVLNVPTVGGLNVSAPLSTPTSVSTRIVSCAAGPFLPAGDTRAVVEIELKRMFRIQSLLFRVLDRTGAAVYQEALNAAQIDTLYETRGEAEPANVITPIGLGADPARYAFEEKQRRLRAIPATGFARPADGPFKFRVWISDQPNAFAAVTLVNDPVEAYGSTVHDQSVRGNPKLGQTLVDYQLKTQKVGRNAAGINQTQVKKVRLIHVAIQAVLSKHGDPSSAVAAATKVTDLQNALAAANLYFGAARPNELRILMGPEWYFQKSVAPNSHSVAEKQTIVTDLTNLSATPAALDWLLLPGTILYEEPLATSGAKAVFNLMPILCNGVLVHEYYKRQWGSDTEEDSSIRPLPTDPAYFSVGLELAANGNEKRAKKLNAGNFPMSLAAPMRLRWGISTSAAGKSVDSGVKPNWQVTANGKHFAVWKPGKNLLRVCRREIFATCIEDDTVWNNWVANGLVRANYIKSNFFLHDNLKFGFEICADHGGGRAAGEYQPADGHVLAPAVNSGVDIHLVSSVGVMPFPWKVVARTGGLYAYLNGEAGQCFAKEVTARTAAIVPAVQNAVRASWATKQAGAFAAAVPPGGVPVGLTAPMAMIADPGINTLKYSSHLLEEV